MGKNLEIKKSQLKEVTYNFEEFEGSNNEV